MQYRVYYPHSDLFSPDLDTVNKQLIFNTNDKNQLGSVGGLRQGEPIYIIGWELNPQGTDVIRKCRKRITYDNQVVVNNDIILHENLVLVTNLEHSNVENHYVFKPNIESPTQISKVIYNVYYDINQANTGSNVADFKLIKTITKNDDSNLLINFTKAGIFKITSEVMIFNNEVSEISENIVDISIDSNITIIESSDRQQHYIEWE
jgi:hypothetical protein